MNFILTRDPGTDIATTGVAVINDIAYYTLEPPWRNNQSGHSCVPLGTYDLIPYVSPRHGPTYCLFNAELKIVGIRPLTPHQIAAGYRSLCELHAANWAEQLEGCIAFGFDHQPMLDPLTGIVEVAIESSVRAVTALLTVLHAERGNTLTICH